MGDYQGRSTIVFFFSRLSLFSGYFFPFFYEREKGLFALPVLLGVIDDQSQTAWTSFDGRAGRSGAWSKRGRT